jgi:hypothetical protein
LSGFPTHKSITQDIGTQATPHLNRHLPKTPGSG